MSLAPLGALCIATVHVVAAREVHDLIHVLDVNSASNFSFQDWALPGLSPRLIEVYQSYG